MSRLWGHRGHSCNIHGMPVPTAARCSLGVATANSITGLASTARSESSRLQGPAFFLLLICVSLLEILPSLNNRSVSSPRLRRAGRASERGAFVCLPTYLISGQYLRSCESHAHLKAVVHWFFLNDGLCAALPRDECIMRQDDKIFEDQSQRTEAGE